MERARHGCICVCGANAILYFGEALVAQRIELFRPKEEMGVQFPPRALMNFLRIERERGRGNGSFPVAEILKPMGVKAQSRACRETSSEIPSEGT